MAGNYPFLIKNYTELTYDELVTVLNTRNHPDVRKWMFNSDEILLQDHLKFIESLKSNTDKAFFAAYNEHGLCGAFNVTGLSGNKPVYGYFATPAIADAMNGIQVYYYGLCFLIERFGLQEVYGTMYDNNKIAHKIARKFGVEETGKKDNLTDVKLNTGKWNRSFTTEELFKFMIDKKASF